MFNLRSTAYQSFWIFLFLLLSRGSASGQQPSPVAKKLEALVDQVVLVELRNGKSYDNAKIIRVTLDTRTGQPKKLRVRCDDGRGRTWSLVAVRSLSHKGKVVYQNKDKGNKPANLSKRERAALRTAEEHQKWLARLEIRGIKPWSKLSDQDHQRAIEAHNKRYEEVAALLPSMQLFETEYFLFCTNIPPQEVGPFIASLDRMYVWMQQTYGLKPDEAVWRGKASVFAFVQESQFVAFEQRFMKNQPKPGTAGLCHYDGNRDVCIAVHQGTSAEYFGVVLVHETSHGFIHCYKTPVQVPSWVNEGMAEVIASVMVPSSQGVQRKEKSFYNALSKSPEPRLGEKFFAARGNIPFDRYGGASSMTRFLLQSDQEAYVHFINLLKEGMMWEEALRNSYNATKQELVASYGQWLGIPHLRP